MSEGMKYVGEPVTKLLGEAYDRGKQFPLAYLVVLADHTARLEQAIVIGTDYYRCPRPEDKHLVGIPADLVVGVGAEPVQAWKTALATAGGRCEVANSVRKRVQDGAPATALSQYRQENIDAEAKKNWRDAGSLQREAAPPPEQPKWDGFGHPPRVPEQLPGLSVASPDELIRQYENREEK